MRILLFLTVIAFAACAEAPEKPKAVISERFSDSPRAVTEYVAALEDFDCILNTAEDKQLDPQTSWHHVRNFYLKNMIGRTQEALDVANGVKPGPYPMGTVIQLIYFEAMVKRGGDYSPDSKGWEFFSLSEEGGGKFSIAARGATDVTNFAGGNCFDCHSQAAPKWDLVCEDGHGCDPLGEAKSIAFFVRKQQEGDPRCK